MQKITWGINSHGNWSAYGSLELSFKNKNNSRAVVGIMGWLARVAHKTKSDIQMLFLFQRSKLISIEQTHP